MMSGVEWSTAILGLLWALLTTGVMYFKGRAALRGVKQQTLLLITDPPEWHTEVALKLKVLRRLFYKEIPLLLAGILTVFPPYPPTEELFFERLLVTILVFMGQAISLSAAVALDEYMDDEVNVEERIGKEAENELH